MSKRNRMSRVANFRDKLGNFEYKNKQKNYELFQKTQHQLNHTATRISQNLPGKINYLTLLFSISCFLPNRTYAHPPKNYASPSPNESHDLTTPEQRQHSSTALAQNLPITHQYQLPTFFTSTKTILSTPHTIPIELKETNDYRSTPENELTSSIEETTFNENLELSVNNTPLILLTSQDEASIDETEENIHLLELLIENGVNLTHRNCTKELVEAAILFSEKNNHSHAALARDLQKAKGFYGGNVEETISFPLQKKIIYDWVMRALFGDKITSMVIKYLVTTEKKTNLTIQDLGDFFENKIRTIGISQKIRKWLFNYVILEELPILYQFSLTKDKADPNTQNLIHIKLQDFEFGQINAGLHFAHLLGLELDSISIKAALEWGKIVYVELQEGIVPIEWWFLFQLPATIRYAQNYPELFNNFTKHEQQDLVIHALVDYNSEYEKFIENTNANYQFKESLKHYKTRPQIAQQIIDSKCPGLKVTTYLNNETVLCAKKNSRKPLPFYPAIYWKSPFSELIKLPNINDKFQSHIDVIANNYKKADELWVILAFNSLSNEEIDFLNNSRITRAQVLFTAADELNFAPFIGGNHYARQSLEVNLDPGVEFFIVQCPKQNERIYALQKTSNGYVIQQSKYDAQTMFSFLGEDKRPIKNSKFKLKIYPSRDVLKLEKKGLDTLIEQMVQRHQKDFADELYQFGFEKTTNEKISDFIFSLVPFYTCFTSSKTEEVIFSCAADLISLIPIMGKFVALGIKLSSISASAAFKTAIEMAQRHLLKEAIKVAGSNFIRFGTSVAVKTMLIEELKKIFVTALITIDPGITLIGSFSLLAVKQAIQFGKSMSSNLHFITALESSLKKLPPEMSFDSFQYGYLRGLNKQIPIIRLVGEQFNGKEIFILRNTLSTRKYTLSTDRILEVIPINLTHRLHNILSQGLGGKGAVSWIPQKNEINAPFLRQVQKKLLQKVSLEQITHQNERLKEQLFYYISPTGVFTKEGMKLLNAAEAGSNLNSQSNRVQPLNSVSSYVKKPISPNQDIQAIVHVQTGKIRIRNGDCFTYDLDLDVFRKTSSEDASVVFFVDHKKGMTALSIEDAEKRAKSITLDQRTAVVKALGIDLDFKKILSAPPYKSAPKKTIPKKIRLLWVGNRPISTDILDTIKHNKEIAIAKGYSIRFYLSEQSKDLNLQNLKDALCGPDYCVFSTLVKIKILEKTPFFKYYMRSISYQQFQDAINGNGGIATNFASAADILRYSWIEKHGGYYLDVDDKLTESLKEVKTEPNKLALSGLLITKNREMNHQFGTSFFGGHRGNTIFKCILEEIHRRYQLPQYRDFYLKPRPPKSDISATNKYVQTLFDLTGPGVFNDVLGKEDHWLKNLMELSKFSELIHDPKSSKLYQKILSKISNIQDISPLKDSHEIGQLHSWRDYR